MATIASEGALVAVQRPWEPAWQRHTVSLNEGYNATYTAIYRQQPAVRTVVDFLARNIAQIGLKVYERLNDTDRVRDTTSSLADTLEMTGTGWTPTRFWRRVVSELAIHDNALAVKVRFGEAQDRVALIPIPWGLVSVTGKSWLSPAGYRINGTNKKFDLDPDQVIHWRGFDPDDLRYGLSPMETLRRILAEEDSAGRYREFFWKNAARPSLVLKRPSTAPEWEEEERKAFRISWEAAYSGAANSGRTPILEDDMDVSEVGFNAKDSEYIASRKLSREEVAAAYGIAPTLVGILDHATFSNIESQHIQLYQDTLGPWLTWLEEDIHLQLRDVDFLDLPRRYVEFDMHEKLKGSFDDEVRALQSAVGGPWMLREEARARWNMPKVDGFDEPIVPMNVTQGGLASPNDTAPKGLAPEHEAEVRRFLERQKTSAQSRIAAALQSGVDPDLNQILDVDRWTAELTADLNRLGG